MSRSRYICGCCGAEIDTKNTKRTAFMGEWRECTLPEGRDWKIPAGKKETADGTIMYIDTYNNLHTREEFLEMFAVDPETAFNYIRSHIRIKRSPRTAKTE